jgi:1,2-diacylglycerol 3-alpha-glucosyltransferase
MTGAPLSICMFSNLFRPVVSGSATQSEALARQLVRLGHKPFVITARVQSDSREYEELDGVPIYRLPALRLPSMGIALNFPWLSWTFTPGNLRRIDELIRKHRPDVLHLHNHMFDLAFTAVRMKRRWQVPLLVTIHTMIRHVKPLYNLLLYPADRVFLRQAVIKRTDAVLCPDHNIKTYVEDAFPGCNAQVCPYGVDIPPAADPVQVEELRRKHNLAGKRVILSLGHVHELRHRRELIRILPEIHQVFPNVVVLIVGAETIDSPRRLAQELKVSDAVIFAGHAPHELVPAYLALADLEMHLFYQDAIERTSLGIASMEAMGAGKAVVVAANQDTFGPGALRPGENVIFVDPTKPQEMTRTLVELLGNPDRCRRIGAAARRFVVDHLSWEVISAQTVDLYRAARQHRSAVTALAPKWAERSQ